MLQLFINKQYLLMHEQLKKLVNDSNLENKSELIANLETLISPNDVNLDLVLKDERFADLNKGINSKIDATVGQNRTKWDEENKKKQVVDPPKKEEQTETDPIITQLLEQNKKMMESINVLTGQQKQNETKDYIKAQTKGLPEQFQKYINVRSDDTKEVIDAQIKTAKELHEDYLKSIDNSPRSSLFKQNNNKNVGTEFAEQKLKKIDGNNGTSIDDYIGKK